MLYRTTFLENWGSGAVRIIDACRKAGVAEPTWKSEGGFVIVTFPRPNGTQDGTQDDTQGDTQDVNLDIWIESQLNLGTKSGTKFGTKSGNSCWNGSLIDFNHRPSNANNPISTKIGTA